MSFNSYLFILAYLPIVVSCYYLVKRWDRENITRWFLLLVSSFFYMYAGVRAFITILVLTLITYLIVRYSYKSKHKKLFMILGIIINVLSLFYFKYLIFAELTLNSILGTSFTYVNFVLPLGISFITFSQISFLVDAYRGNDKNNESEFDLTKVSLSEYALYILFFPKVIMGPIALAADYMKEQREALSRKIDYEKIAYGFIAFTLGLSKKVLLADVLCKYVDWGFKNNDDLGTFTALIVILAYTCQIYFDFSGFSDMAYGICLMLNTDLPINFNSPYRALSIVDFWDRWHITLTEFFTKYIYIPLGGSRKGNVRTYVNIMIVFLISGIWHGSAVTFIIWGVMHGIGNCISRYIDNLEKSKGLNYKSKEYPIVPKVIRYILTFSFINIAWVYFRAATVGEGNQLLVELFSGRFKLPDLELVAEAFPKELEIIQWTFVTFFKELNLNIYFGNIVVIAFIVFAVFASVGMKNTQERIELIKANGIKTKDIVIFVILFVWSVISLAEVSGFIYVNF